MPKPLKISLCGQELEAQPFAVSGCGLLCHTGPNTSSMVLEHMVRDKQAFWDAWKALGGESQGLVWESGGKFLPPGSEAAKPSKAKSWLAQLWDRFWLWLFPWEED